MTAQEVVTATAQAQANLYEFTKEMMEVDKADGIRLTAIMESNNEGLNFLLETLRDMSLINDAEVGAAQKLAGNTK